MKVSPQVVRVFFANTAHRNTHCYTEIKLEIFTKSSRRVLHTLGKHGHPGVLKQLDDSRVGILKQCLTIMRCHAGCLRERIINRNIIASLKQILIQPILTTNIMVICILITAWDSPRQQRAPQPHVHGIKTCNVCCCCVTQVQ